MIIEKTTHLWIDKWGNTWPSKDEYLEYEENHPNYEKKESIEARTDSNEAMSDPKVMAKNKKKFIINCFGCKIYYE